MTQATLDTLSVRKCALEARVVALEAELHEIRCKKRNHKDHNATEVPLPIPDCSATLGTAAFSSSTDDDSVEVILTDHRGTCDSAHKSLLYLLFPFCDNAYYDLCTLDQKNCGQRRRGHSTLKQRS